MKVKKEFPARVPEGKEFEGMGGAAALRAPPDRWGARLLCQSSPTVGIANCRRGGVDKKRPF